MESSRLLRPTATANHFADRSIRDQSRIQQSPPAKKPARVCLCAPTNHPGSFRCRFHRAQASFGGFVGESSKSSQLVGNPTTAKPAVPKSITPPPPAPSPLTPARKRVVGASRLSRMSASSQSQQETGGPLRFLKWAAGSGASAVTGAGSLLRRGPGNRETSLVSDESGIEREVYEVKKGDSLGAICKKLGVSMEVVSTANDIKDVDSIFPGQKLWIPKTYTIEKGDNLNKIAQKFNTTVEALLKYNEIDNPDQIKHGDVILLPL